MNFRNMSAEELQARLAEIRTLVDTDGSDLEALETEARQIREELERREQEESRRQQLREQLANGGLQTNPIERQATLQQTNEEIRNSREYINAYAEYVRTGDDTECRALLTENVSGTVPIPELVEEEVRTAWDREGITRRVRKAH